METRLNLLGSKKIKWAIVSTLMVLGMALGITIFSVARTLNPGLTFNVEFVTGVSDVLIQTYQKGEKLNFPNTPTKDGYCFMGWSLDKNSNNFISTDFVVDKELTIYANWQQKQYNLTFENKTYNLNHNTNLSLLQNKVCFSYNNNLVALEAPTIKNKTFLKWQISDGTNTFEVTNFNFNSVNGTNLTLVPIYADIVVNYSIYGDFSKATVNKPLNGNITLGDSLEFELTLNNSVNNSNISLDVSSGKVNYVKNENTYKVVISDFDDNVNIYINNITLNNYLIEYNLGETTTKLMQKHGETITPPVLNKEGYKLAGFKDSFGNPINLNHLITSNMVLTPVWEIETYTVEFPKSYGQYVVNINGKHFNNGETLGINYGEDLTLEITLSRAYSSSNIAVYAITNDTIINPTIVGKSYTFKNITNNLKLFVDNVKINTYSLIVDDKNYGCFSYGSWISVENNSIIITENITRNTTSIAALTPNEMFGGWYYDETEVLTNSFIQDIENMQVVNISGKYFKNATRIQLVLNGGSADTTELVIIENEDYLLPTPTKSGYEFVGWFTTLVEVNTQVNEELSEKFTEITGRYLVLYAGWKLKI